MINGVPMQLLITNYETLTRIRVGTVHIFLPIVKIAIATMVYVLPCISRHGKKLR